MDLLARVKRHRGVQSIEHEGVPNVQELLEQVQRSLQSHGATAGDFTHICNYTDWWMDPRQPCRYLAAEGEALHVVVAQMYSLGIPLTICEKRSAQFTLFQDVEIMGTVEETVPAEELLSEQSDFVLLLGQTMRRLYPDHENLLMVAFDATGLSMTERVMKTTIRLVWPEVVVDTERALVIRGILVNEFVTRSSHEGRIRELHDSIARRHRENQWGTIFRDAGYDLRTPSVLMPLCDRVSPNPLPMPEKRSLKPVGVFSFTSARGREVESVELICGGRDGDGLGEQQWLRAVLKLGCVRQPECTPLTPWSGVPCQRVQRALRTRRGSSEGRCRPSRPAPRRTSEPKMMGNLRFSGTTEEFRQRLMENHLHDQGEIVSEVDGLTWRKRGDERSFIQFQASSAVVSSTAPADPRTDRRSSQGVAAPADHGATAAELTAAKAFEPEGPTELGLSVGDRVGVLQDSYAQTRNIRRWVYGCNKNTGKSGLFPLSYCHA